MRLLLAGDLHHLPVLAFNELVPSIPLDIVAEMNWAPPALDGLRELEEAA